MGLNTSENKTFLKIKDGKFFKTTDKECTTPFNSLDGIITGMKFRKSKLPTTGEEIEQLEVTVKSGDEVFQFGISIQSAAFSSFMNFLSNVDISKQVVIVPKSQTREDGKVSKTVLVGQEGSFKAKYTKANPGNLPPLKQVTHKGKLEWDNTDQMNFWREVITTKYSNLSATETPKNTEPVVQDEPAHVGGKEEEDDLPF